MTEYFESETKHILDTREALLAHLDHIIEYNNHRLDEIAPNTLSLEDGKLLVKDFHRYLEVKDRPEFDIASEIVVQAAELHGIMADTKVPWEPVARAFALRRLIALAEQPWQHKSRHAARTRKGGKKGARAVQNNARERERMLQREMDRLHESHPDWTIGHLRKDIAGRHPPFEGTKKFLERNNIEPTVGRKAKSKTPHESLQEKS